MSQPGFKEETPLQLAWSDQDELKLSGVSVGRSVSDIHLSFKGKKKIGIIGASGAGKSTLIDILGGFLEPDGGMIEVNGTSRSHLQDGSWQKNLLYIPQHPYILMIRLATTFASTIQALRQRIQHVLLPQRD